MGSGAPFPAFAVDSGAPERDMGTLSLHEAPVSLEAVEVTAIALTKLDGTSKGGIVFAISDDLGLPVRFVGTGEGEDDLNPFDAGAFVDALFD